MVKQIIDIGSSPDDNTGDSIRDSFDKVNDNFTEQYTRHSTHVQPDQELARTLTGVHTTWQNQFVLAPSITGNISVHPPIIASGRKFTTTPISPIAFRAAQYHSTADHLYAAVLATRVRLTVTNVVGTFTIGEEIEQTSSGAKARYVRTDSGVVYVASVSGTFDGTNGITGATSGATADVSAEATDSDYRFLIRSNGTEDFFPVLDFEGSVAGTLLRCLIDIGPINIGGTEKRVVFWTTYEDNAKKIYYNIPADDDVWQELLSVSDVGGVAPIRHWHGGIWIDELGANDGTLVLFTGDSGSENSILVCDDVEHLLNNPGTWLTRWGLDVAGANRTSFFDGNDTYVWIYGTASARTVDLVIDEDGAKGYYLPDASDVDGFGGKQRLHTVDLATGTVSSEGANGQFRGAGWYGIRAAGRVFLTDLSKTSGGALVDSNDYVSLYVVENATLHRVYEWLRSDIGDYAANAQIQHISAIDDVIGVVGQRLTNTHNPLRVTGQQTRQSPSRFGQPDMTRGNLLVDGMLRTQLPAHSPTRCTVERDTTVGEDGHPSIKITPTSDSGSAVMDIPLPDDVLDTYRGQYLTVYGRVLAPTSLAGTQEPFAGWKRPWAQSQSDVSQISQSDDWQDWSRTIFVYDAATEATVRLQAANSGTDTDPVWFGPVRVVAGARPLTLDHGVDAASDIGLPRASAAELSALSVTDPRSTSPADLLAANKASLKSLGSPGGALIDSDFYSLYEYFTDDLSALGDTDKAVLTLDNVARIASYVVVTAMQGYFPSNSPSNHGVIRKQFGVMVRINDQTLGISDSVLTLANTFTTGDLRVVAKGSDSEALIELDGVISSADYLRIVVEIYGYAKIIATSVQSQA